MKLKSIFSDLLVTIISLVAAFAAVSAAMAFQEEPQGFERYDQASPESSVYLLAYNTTRVSIASNGTQANSHSWGPTISADGRYVAFTSWASNLVVGDTNGFEDVFVHDRETGETTRVSVASDGAQANGFSSQESSISADGRYVAFASGASNLVAGDTNERNDIFVHDCQTGETNRVSLASDGTQANDSSFLASISADGRFVAFGSYASDLVTGDTNMTGDIFVHDRETGETTRVSVASDGAQANGFSSQKPAISADGRYVAFASWASNLVMGDTNGENDVFVHDRQTGETARVSVASDGTQANSGSTDISISADGRYVVFNSSADNLTVGDINERDDIFVHDRQTGETSRVSVASDGSQAIGSSSQEPAISADGRYVTFYSYASNLVTGDTNMTGDIFVHDRQTGETSRIPNSPPGFQANAASFAPSISANGRAIAFASFANNLIAGDTNDRVDVFVYDSLGKTTPASRAGNQPLALTLFWHDDDDTTAGYEYCLGTARGDCNITDWTSTGSNTSVALNDLAFSTTYYWQVRTDTAIEADGGAWWSFETIACGQTFPDVSNEFWACVFVERLASAGVTSGYPDGTFHPDAPVTRGQAAVFLLKATNYPALYTAPPAPATFPDTAGHWAEEWIEALKDTGITGGFPDRTFRPDAPVTRAQMAVFLLKALNGPGYEPPAATATFDDTSGHWASNWIEALKAAGITSGYPDGTYRPGNYVTRAEMAVFLVKAFGLP